MPRLPPHQISVLTKSSQTYYPIHQKGGLTVNNTEAIEHLEQSEEYRVIERLNAPERYWHGEPCTPRIGVVIDVEATGLDTDRDKIIELGFVAFEYDAGSGLIYRILHTYDAFEDPGEPLSDIVKQITGITDAMLAGQQLDEKNANIWLQKADLIIAHNAAFDRQLLERRLPSVSKTTGAAHLMIFPGRMKIYPAFKLDYIAYKLGFFSMAIVLSMMLKPH